MNSKNILQELKNAPVDTSANIRIVKLTGSEELSVYVAEIAAHTELNPHYHTDGIEAYQIYSGDGVMKTGTLSDGNVIWNEPIAVSVGDFFSIEEWTVHQLCNESSLPLIAIFTCPENHVSSDRFFTQKGE